jgi:hypothetical protein
VAPEFVNHPPAKKLALHGMVEDVKPDQALEQLLVFQACHRRVILPHQYRFSIS